MLVVVEVHSVPWKQLVGVGFQENHNLAYVKPKVKLILREIIYKKKTLHKSYLYSSKTSGGFLTVFKTGAHNFCNIALM